MLVVVYNITQARKSKSNFFLLLKEREMAKKAVLVIYLGSKFGMFAAFGKYSKKQKCLVPAIVSEQDVHLALGEIIWKIGFPYLVKTVQEATIFYAPNRIRANVERKKRDLTSPKMAEMIKNILESYGINVIVSRIPPPERI